MWMDAKNVRPVLFLQLVFFITCETDSLDLRNKNTIKHVDA